VVGKANGSTGLSGLSQPCYEIGILICAALLIHSFNVLIGYFKCLTQFGGSSHCLNFADKFCDTPATHQEKNPDWRKPDPSDPD